MLLPSRKLSLRFAWLNKMSDTGTSTCSAGSRILEELLPPSSDPQLPRLSMDWGDLLAFAAFDAFLALALLLLRIGAVNRVSC